MRYANIFLGLLSVAEICARRIPDTAALARGINSGASIDEALSGSVSRDVSKLPTRLSRSAGSQNDRRDTYPINCHIHNWPSASVDSIKQAYSWFYQLWAPLEADAQQCRRIACFGDSAVWMCADTLGYQSINSVRIADQMNDLLDGDHGCLDPGNKNMVQGMKFTSEGWNIVVRGGEDCSTDAAEMPIFY
ncbi:hypothetical protein O1611_g4442 [Lasiodiplodia mahajangana]|uniref:Uncharacterized protein n=1 Tax=Lasiodiplodia mahajangana TaxID=1108764 RepID=A0ACC2JP43_9PEZI|nr:hypothetical protein O1611_g4442 [Lasiodiplodia mahajangana]